MRLPQQRNNDVIMMGGVSWPCLRSAVMLCGSKFEIHRCYHLYVAEAKIENFWCLAL